MTPREFLNIGLVNFADFTNDNLTCLINGNSTELLVIVSGLFLVSHIG